MHVLTIFVEYVWYYGFYAMMTKPMTEILTLHHPMTQIILI